MLRALIFSAALLPSLALADTFGSPDACRLYAAGGSDAVVSLGGSIGASGPYDDETAGYLLVTPTEVLGDEWGCRRTPMGLACSGEGEDFALTATIEQNGSVLTFTDEDGTITLQRCDFREALAPN